MKKGNTYRWAKVKNGIPNIAIVHLDSSENLSQQNVINEYYSGKGFIGQGIIEDISSRGYDSWKIGAIKGLEYAFSKTEKFWTVDLFSIKGMTTDTNPTIVGYTVIRAFFNQIHYNLTPEEIENLENFVSSSWRNQYKELIPDFFTLTFSEYN